MSKMKTDLAQERTELLPCPFYGSNNIDSEYREGWSSWGYEADKFGGDPEAGALV